MKTKTLYYTGKGSYRGFLYPGSKIVILSKGDSIEVPKMYLDLVLKQWRNLFTENDPASVKELKESETKEFTGGITKDFSRQSKKKRKQ